jgi:hypothetical protein
MKVIKTLDELIDPSISPSLSDAQNLLDKTYLWLINMTPGSTFDLTTLEPKKRDLFLKIARLFIAENHQNFTLNDDFTTLFRDPIPYELGHISFYRTIIQKQLKENIIMNNHQKIESPEGQVITIGRVNDGYLNVMTSFNPIELRLDLKKLTDVIVKGIYAYDDGTGGISLQISDDFRYVKFVEQLTDLFMAIETAKSEPEKQTVTL